MILLVEDNDDDRQLAIRAFRELGADVRTAHDGQDALQLLLPKDGSRGLAPLVVLLDLKMPLVDGFAVLRALRKDPRTRNLPVVVLTSSEEERDLVESYALGANSYVKKPLGYTDFTEIARSLAHYWLEVNRVPG